MADSFALTNDGQVVLGGDSSIAGTSASLSGSTSAAPVTGSTNISANAGALQVSGRSEQAVAQAIQQTTQEEESPGLLNALATLTGGALDRYISTKQTEAYYNGMAKVVQGKALTDIEAEQPWYTKIFGPDATVKGAQAMAATTAIQDAQTQFMNDLPSLASQSPDDVRRYLVKQASQIDVGDETTNAVIQSKLAEGWGPMLEAHMKKHYAWVQTQNANQYSNMQLSQGRWLQSVASQGAGEFLSSDTGVKAVKQTIAQIDTNPGMDQETFKAAALSTYTANIAAGNYIYGRIFKSSQTYKDLSAEDKKKVDDAQEKYELKGLKDLDETNIGMQKADLYSSALHGDLSRNEILKQTHDINTLVQKQTGISQPYIDGKEVIHLMEGNNNAIFRAEDKLNARQQKLTDQAAKDAAKQRDTMVGVSLINGGDPDGAIVSQAMTKPEAENYISAKFTSLPTPEDQAAFLAKTNSRGFVSDRVQSLVQQGIRSSIGKGYNDSFATSAAYYQTLANTSPATADAYFGNYAPQMKAYSDMTSAGVQPQDAWAATFEQQPRLDNLQRNYGGYAKAQQAVQSAVGSAWSSGIQATLGFKDTAAPYLIRRMSIAAAPKMDAYLSDGVNMTTDDAAKVVVKNMGVDQLGEDGYIRARGQNTVAQDLHLPTDAIGPVFAALRDKKLADIGATKDQITGIVRSDNKGQVKLFMTVLDSNGVTHTVPFDGSEINDAYMAQRKIRNNSKAPFNPNGFNRPAGTGPTDF